MEDLKELYRVLEQLDAEGDTDSVSQLIPYIKQVEAAQTTQPTETAIDVTKPLPDLTKPPTLKPVIPQSKVDVMGTKFTPEEYAKYSGMPIAAKPGEQAKGEFSGNFGVSLYNLAAQLALAQGKVTGNYKEAEETAKRLREYGEKTYTAADTTWKEDPIAKIQQ